VTGSAIDTAGKETSVRSAHATILIIELSSWGP
jgi:hypothetical protein